MPVGTIRATQLEARWRVVARRAVQVGPTEKIEQAAAPVGRALAFDRSRATFMMPTRAGQGPCRNQVANLGWVMNRRAS